jgi:hypothetical protein
MTKSCRSSDLQTEIHFDVSEEQESVVYTPCPIDCILELSLDMEKTGSVKTYRLHLPFGVDPCERKIHFVLLTAHERHARGPAGAVVSIGSEFLALESAI